MTKHWKTLIATAALLGTTSGVAIAGGYETAGRSYAPAPKANWSGFYLGRHVGVGFQDVGDRDATVNGGGGGGGGGGRGSSSSSAGGDGGNGGNPGAGGGGGGGGTGSVGGDGGDDNGGGGGGGGFFGGGGGDGGNNNGGGGGGGGPSFVPAGDGGDNNGAGGNGGDPVGGAGGAAGGGNGGDSNSGGGGGGGSGGGDGGVNTVALGGGGGGGSNGDGGDGVFQAGGGGGGSNGDGGDGGGLVAGGGGGGGTGATVAARITSDDTNLLAGTHVGYNWQWRHTVLGVEGDYSANDNLDDYLASLRGRLGWATGNYLLYGTAGVAFAGRGGGDDAIGVAGAGGSGGDGGASSASGGGSGGNGGPGDGITRFGDRDDDETGWVAGGGIEAMLSPMAIVGLEALYYMIDGDNRTGNTGDDDFLAIRARLSAHLGGGAFSTAPTANWAGLYVGGNIGALFNQNDKIASVQLAGGAGGGNGGNHGGGGSIGSGAGGGGGGGGAAALATLEDDSSVVGGAHAGFNWQNGQWVHGVEGDIGAVEDTYEYVASLRGRLGWAYEQVLLYATAGVAFAKNDGFDGTVSVGGGSSGNDGASSASGGAGGAGGAGGVAFTANTGPSDNVDLGLVIGAGTDVKLSHSLSVGMEGMYHFFFDGGDDPIINAPATISVGDLNDDTEFAVVRARVTYHFGSQPAMPLK